MNKKYSKRIFSIPLRWEKSFIDDVLKSETEKGIIGGFYGCIDFEGVRNGRVPLKHQKIEVKNAKKVVEYIHQCGRRIKYLINAPEPSSGEQDISDIIQIIIDELGVDAVVVSSYKMMDRIRNHSLSIDIHVSTIARVSSPTELELYTQFSPVRLIPQHDVPKKPNTLSVLLQSCKKKKIDLEIMVTESCLFECPWMQSHYQSLADGHEDREHHRLCREARQKTPSHLIACGSFIRPQDLWIYQDLGINNFKISGRSKSRNWLLRAAKAYCSGYYDGNLVDLMGMDPKVVPEERIFLKAEALDGFVQTLFEDNHSDPIRLAEEYTMRALDRGMLKISDFLGNSI